MWLAALLRESIEQDSKEPFRRVWLFDLLKNAAEVVWSKAAEALGIVGANWHWLRHANATLLDAVGTPLGTVQALLGHSSAEVTREVYLHSLPADAKRAVADVEKLIGLNWTQVLEIPKTERLLIQ